MSVPELFYIREHIILPQNGPCMASDFAAAEGTASDFCLPRIREYISLNYIMLNNRKLLYTGRTVSTLPFPYTHARAIMLICKTHFQFV